MSLNKLKETLNWQGDEALLTQALTHRSMGAQSYEKLEFVGDRVLNLAVAAWLYRQPALADEGQLSLQHTALVCEAACAQIAQTWELWPHLQVANQAHQAASARQRILADAVEALLGALYLRQGMPAVQMVVERDWAALLANLPSPEKDAKTALQELLQAQGAPLPSYTVVGQTGPDHHAEFTVNVTCTLGQAQGVGSSKQAASLQAAANLMKIFKQ